MSSTAVPRPKPWETSASLEEPQRNAQSLSAMMTSNQQDSRPTEESNNSNSASESAPEVLPRPAAPTPLVPTANRIQYREYTVIAIMGYPMIIIRIV